LQIVCTNGRKHTCKTAFCRNFRPEMGPVCTCNKCRACLLYDIIRRTPTKMIKGICCQSTNPKYPPLNCVLRRCFQTQCGGQYLHRVFQNLCSGMFVDQNKIITYCQIGKSIDPTASKKTQRSTTVQITEKLPWKDLILKFCRALDDRWMFHHVSYVHFMRTRHSWIYDPLKWRPDSICFGLDFINNPKIESTMKCSAMWGDRSGCTYCAIAVFYPQTSVDQVHRKWVVDSLARKHVAIFASDQKHMWPTVLRYLEFMIEHAVSYQPRLKVLYLITDGGECHCSGYMACLTVLVQKYKNLDRIIHSLSPPQHGKWIYDGMGGSDKKILQAGVRSGKVKYDLKKEPFQVTIANYLTDFAAKKVDTGAKAIPREYHAITRKWQVNHVPSSYVCSTIKGIKRYFQWMACKDGTLWKRHLDCRCPGCVALRFGNCFCKDIVGVWEKEIPAWNHRGSVWVKPDLLPALPDLVPLSDGDGDNE